MRRPRAIAIGALIGAAWLSAADCGEDSPSRIAAKVLEKYRRASGAKPLPASGMTRIRLVAAQAPPAPGASEVLWETDRYRESVSSAGMTTYRGIESGKAYFVDEDGVTRVASDPVLRELRSRSYFWRRAWLFEDYGGARRSLGPADDATASVRLTPEGGNSILLTFSRRNGGLTSVRSPRFHLEFSSAVSFRDLSDPGRPVAGEITWTGLPTGRIPNPSVGGERVQFGEASTGVPLERRQGGILVPARISGQDIRLAVDAAADGPVRLSPALAARLNLRLSRDVFGRSIAAGASMEIGGVRYPALFVQVSDAIPSGADAVAGGCLFREAIVELDPQAGRFGLHDPARWTPPDGYYRIVIDDDDDRPVAILNRGSHELRLAAGSAIGDDAIWVAAESADHAGLADARLAKGLTWGIVRLPPLALRVWRAGFFPDWGEDGRLGFTLLLRFHTYVNMPQRWIYVKPIRR